MHLTVDTTTELHLLALEHRLAHKQREPGPHLETALRLEELAAELEQTWTANAEAITEASR